MRTHRSLFPSLLALSAWWLAACGDDDGMPAVTADGGMEATDAGPPPECEGRPAEAPETRGEVAGAFDAERGRILVFGGDTAAPEMCMPRYELVAELWAFHLDCNSWELLDAEAAPGIRSRHAVTLDEEGGRMLLFGGRNRIGFGEYENFADVWAFDFATDTWTEIETTGEGPSPRSSAVIGHDAERNRLIVFGGNVSTGGLTLEGVGDTWALDLDTGEWTAIEGEAPPPRLHHAGTVISGALHVFGGTPNFSGPYYNDVWSFDFAADRWTMVRGGGPDAPETRFGSQLYADRAGGRLFVVAGHDLTAMGNRNDVYALALEDGEWVQVQPGDTLTGEAAGMCDFPADFTAPEEGSPERRSLFLGAQSEGTAYVFGGKTDCGNINDVWALDFADGAWRQLRPATGGEACNRSGSTTCTSLCF